MAKLKLHYDGWLALPTDVRRRFGVSTGDQLELEWVEGGVLLKMPGGAASTSKPEEQPEAEPIPEEAKAKPAAPKKATSRAKPKPRQRSPGKLAGSLLPKTAGRRATKAKT